MRVPGQGQWLLERFLPPGPRLAICPISIPGLHPPVASVGHENHVVDDRHVTRFDEFSRPVTRRAPRRLPAQFHGWHLSGRWKLGFRDRHSRPGTVSAGPQIWRRDYLHFATWPSPIEVNSRTFRLILVADAQVVQAGLQRDHVFGVLVRNQSLNRELTVQEQPSRIN